MDLVFTSDEILPLGGGSDADSDEWFLTRKRPLV